MKGHRKIFISHETKAWKCKRDELEIGEGKFYLVKELIVDQRFASYYTNLLILAANNRDKLI